MVAAALMGWMPTLNDGTTVRNWFDQGRSSPWVAKSSGDRPRRVRREGGAAPRRTAPS